jgi:hypothetical protein
MIRPLLILPLAVLLAPASAQPSASHPNVRVVDCDPAGPATPPRGAMCAAALRPERPLVDRAQDAASATVTRIYAHMERGDAGAIAAALDDHVMWAGPDGRLTGRAAVAGRLAALALPVPLAIRLDAPGRVVATSPQPDGGTSRTVWRLADGRVTGVEHVPEPPDQQVSNL